MGGKAWTGRLTDEAGLHPQDRNEEEVLALAPNCGPTRWAYRGTPPTPPRRRPDNDVIAVRDGRQQPEAAASVIVTRRGRDKRSAGSVERSGIERDPRNEEAPSPHIHDPKLLLRSKPSSPGISIDGPRGLASTRPEPLPTASRRQRTWSNEPTLLPDQCCTWPTPSIEPRPHLVTPWEAGMKATMPW